MPISDQSVAAARRISIRRLAVVLALALIINTNVSVADGRQDGYEVYEWRAPDGTVEYSDEARPGAKPKHVQEPMTVAPAAVTGNRPVARPAGADRSGPRADAGYELVVIESPRQDDVLWVNPATPVMVSVGTEPALRAGDRVVLEINGSRHAERTGGSFQLRELERGTYAVSALVVDGKGQERGRSKPVTFHVKRPSVGGQ